MTRRRSPLGPLAAAPELLLPCPMTGRPPPPISDEAVARAIRIAGGVLREADRRLMRSCGFVRSRIARSPELARVLADARRRAAPDEGEVLRVLERARSTREAARLLGTTPARVRSLAEALGVAPPRGRPGRPRRRAVPTPFAGRASTIVIGDLGAIVDEID